MATKLPTKEEFLEALRQKGIKNLEDLVDAIIPETGAYKMNDTVFEVDFEWADKPRAAKADDAAGIKFMGGWGSLHDVL